jgi:phage repressor protein C with HTH and peptisase S24 domain
MQNTTTKQTLSIDESFQLLDINALVTGGREGFAAFEVTGDSMVDHIHAGYLVFVDTWAEPRNGDIVAAVVNGLTCIKIFQQSTRGLYLVSANTECPPANILDVLGVVSASLVVYKGVSL